MKTEKISINKTPERPDGVEIELVQPETPLEERLMCFLLTTFAQNLKRDERIPYDLPVGFKVEHTRAGTFILSGQGGAGQYYEPPRPIAIMGLRTIGQRFDLVHAPAAAAMRPPQPQAAAPAQELAATKAAETTPGPEPAPEAQPQA